jgi:hypothetical protein
MVFNVFAHIQEIICPECKIKQCSHTCLHYTKMRKLQKLLFTVIMIERSRIKKLMASIDLDKIVEDIQKQPEKNSKLLGQLLNIIVDGKMQPRPKKEEIKDVEKDSESNN